MMTPKVPVLEESSKSLAPQLKKQKQGVKRGIGVRLGESGIQLATAVIVFASATDDSALFTLGLGIACLFAFFIWRF